MFGKKKKAVAILGESWDTYSYVYGKSQRAVISFDVTLATEEKHQRYNHSARVIVFIPLEKALPNGLPGKDEWPLLHELEVKLLKTLQGSKVDCKFAGRMTYGGMRELVFQVEDIKGFQGAASKLIKGARGYKIELREETGWRFFDKKVTPSPVFWQQISDRQVIDQLVKAGSNPQAPHLLEHTLLGDQGTMDKLKSQLIADGFQEMQSGDGRLVMAKGSALDLDQVFGLTGRLFTYCQKIGVRYDGWRAKVAK